MSPVKTKTHRPYHKGHHKEKHTKRFVKVYAPYLPLLLIVITGMLVSFSNNLGQFRGGVLSFATNMSDPGLLEATNQERVKNGLSPLTFNAKLDEAAQAKAQDMANKNYWSHNTPDGAEPWMFIDKASYSYFKAAENLAYGFDTSNDAVVGWMNSPTHRANILDADLKDVGFGIINAKNYQNQEGETIVVAMYGLQTPSSATAITDTTKPLATSPITNANVNGEKKISYIQTLTGGYIPWITLFIGVLIGLIVMYLILKHAHGLHKSIRRGERFILRHPLLDITLVAFVALAAVIMQTAGFIQ